MFAELSHLAAPLYKFVGASALMAVGLTAPLAALLFRLRSVMKRGYRPEDIAVALRARYLRRREEFLYEFGQTTSFRERLMGAASIGALIGLGFGVVALVAGGPRSAFVPLAVMSGYAGIIGTIFSTKWRRLRSGAGSKWAEFWNGRVGKTLARAASFRLERREVPANRPTELAIAMSAEALFASFTKDVRASLGDVPGVLRALEAHAQSARAWVEEVDATIAQAQHAPSAGLSDERHAKLIADLRGERAKAEARLSDVVTALENVRLDMLRLHAGAQTPEGITQDLAAARALGEDADRLLAGLREAEASLDGRGRDLGG